MTRDQFKTMLPILDAWANDKPIQVRPPGGQWCDITTADPEFHPDKLEYRIAPRPREFWLLSSKVHPGQPWRVWFEEPAATLPDDNVVHVGELI